VAQLGARLDGIEEVVGSNPIGSTNIQISFHQFFYSLPISPQIKSRLFRMFEILARVFIRDNAGCV
jgi:hypothetical protein